METSPQIDDFSSSWIDSMIFLQQQLLVALFYYRRYTPYQKTDIKMIAYTSNQILHGTKHRSLFVGLVPGLMVLIIYWCSSETLGIEINDEPTSIQRQKMLRTWDVSLWTVCPLGMFVGFTCKILCRLGTWKKALENFINTKRALNGKRHRRACSFYWNWLFV